MLFLNILKTQAIYDVDLHFNGTNFRKWLRFNFFFIEKYRNRRERGIGEIEEIIWE